MVGISCFHYICTGNRRRRERGSFPSSFVTRELRISNKGSSNQRPRTQPRHDRRDLPAGDQGPRRGQKFAADGYTIVLIGHAGHEEVEGTMGEAPENIVLVESEEDVDRLDVEDPDRMAYISQTTLSVDETRAIINRLRQRFPAIVGPRTDDICYATTNRQAAVKQLARECDLVLVIGSRNSSNSNRLVEVAREQGADAHLIDSEVEVREEWLTGTRVVGITSGASVPELLVRRLVDSFGPAGRPTWRSSRWSRRTCASCSLR